MKHSIRVLVVDDHFIVRKGVCALLADAEDIVVAGEAGNGQQAIQEARRLRPQVILMDLRLHGIDGVAATRVILAELPDTAVVILTSTDVEDELLAAVEAGAQGYLAKTSTPEDFFEAIRRVAQGGVWLPARLTRRLASRLEPRPPTLVANPLTRREREVLKMLARGWSNRRISQELAIEEVTVRTHVSHVLSKLGVNNRVEAALHALGAAGSSGS
jgi:DNA-binding NarL/FixJ family response regulator